ncbi:MAG: GntR family transcriptional regulator [Oscillospiraceae bacterium]|nr:GntR family transcriptional regulator [Oscillospiraceae bacterium]MBR0062820.1 GntR family transcriptional regulator [Oscillospiraceae bacterium]
MDTSFRSNEPIYLQLMERFKLSIASGELLPGDKLRSVRDLAIWAGVNPNTMQRALSELERDGLIYTQRTSGKYVTEDAEIVSRVKTELAEAKTAEYLRYMRSLGLSSDEISAFISKKEDENANS